MKVRDVMTPAPIAVDPLSSVQEVARVMRDHNVGMVLVADPDQVFGLVTDRDLVVRGLAAGEDIRRTEVNSVCSAQLVVVEADKETGDAREAMETHTVRRLPVVENGDVVGVVTLGDIAAVSAPESTLGVISSAPPNQ
jgi:signal-transduction protein with cAMP-binding, CBS, and nucleotidyltransferase domain